MNCRGNQNYKGCVNSCLISLYPLQQSQPETHRHCCHFWPQSCHFSLGKQAKNHVCLYLSLFMRYYFSYVSFICVSYLYLCDYIWSWTLNQNQSKNGTVLTREWRSGSSHIKPHPFIATHVQSMSASGLLCWRNYLIWAPVAIYFVCSRRAAFTQSCKKPNHEQLWFRCLKESNVLMAGVTCDSYLSPMFWDKLCPIPPQSSWLV